MAKAVDYIEQPRTTDMGPILEELNAQIEAAKERLDRLIGQREMVLRLIRDARLAQQGAVTTNGADG
jgi:hypothetical protein